MAALNPTPTPTRLFGKGNPRIQALSRTPLPLQMPALDPAPAPSPSPSASSTQSSVSVAVTSSLVRPTPTSAFSNSSTSNQYADIPQFIRGSETPLSHAQTPYQQHQQLRLSAQPLQHYLSSGQSTTPFDSKSLQKHRQSMSMQQQNLAYNTMIAANPTVGRMSARPTDVYQQFETHYTPTPVQHPQQPPLQLPLSLGVGISPNPPRLMHQARLITAQRDRYLAQVEEERALRDLQHHEHQEQLERIQLMLIQHEQQQFSAPSAPTTPVPQLATNPLRSRETLSTETIVSIVPRQLQIAQSPTPPPPMQPTIRPVASISSPSPQELRHRQPTVRTNKAAFQTPTSHQYQPVRSLVSAKQEAIEAQTLTLPIYGNDSSDQQLHDEMEEDVVIEIDVSIKDEVDRIADSLDSNATPTPTDSDEIIVIEHDEDVTNRDTVIDDNSTTSSDSDTDSITAIPSLSQPTTAVALTIADTRTQSLSRPESPMIDRSKMKSDISLTDWSLKLYSYRIIYPNDDDSDIDNAQVQLIVKGHNGDEDWSSSLILGRYQNDSRCLVTASRLYRLIGPCNVDGMVVDGWTDHGIELFLHGLVPDWKRLIIDEIQRRFHVGLEEEKEELSLVSQVNGGVSVTSHIQQQQLPGTRESEAKTVTAGNKKSKGKANEKSKLPVKRAAAKRRTVQLQPVQEVKDVAMDEDDGSDSKPSSSGVTRVRQRNVKPKFVPKKDMLEDADEDDSEPGSGSSSRSGVKATITRSRRSTQQTKSTPVSNSSTKKANTAAKTTEVEESKESKYAVSHSPPQSASTGSASRPRRQHTAVKVWKSDEWTQAEQSLLIAAASDRPPTTDRDWQSVASAVGHDRTGAECRKEWENIVKSQQKLERKSQHPSDDGRAMERMENSDENDSARAREAEYDEDSSIKASDPRGSPQTLAPARSRALVDAIPTSSLSLLASPSKAPPIPSSASTSARRSADRTAKAVARVIIADELGQSNRTKASEVEASPQPTRVRPSKSMQLSPPPVTPKPKPPSKNASRASRSQTVDDKPTMDPSPVHETPAPRSSLSRLPNPSTVSVTTKPTPAKPSAVKATGSGKKSVEEADASRSAAPRSAAKAKSTEENDAERAVNLPAKNFAAKSKTPARVREESKDEVAAQSARASAKNTLTPVRSRASLEREESTNEKQPLTTKFNTPARSAAKTKRSVVSSDNEEEMESFPQSKSKSKSRSKSQPQSQSAKKRAATPANVKTPAVAMEIEESDSEVPKQTPRSRVSQTPASKRRIEAEPESSVTDAASVAHSFSRRSGRAVIKPLHYWNNEREMFGLIVKGTESIEHAQRPAPLTATVAPSKAKPSSSSLSTLPSASVKSSKGSRDWDDREKRALYNAYLNVWPIVPATFWRDVASLLGTDRTAEECQRQHELKWKTPKKREKRKKVRDESDGDGVDEDSGGARKRPRTMVTKKRAVRTALSKRDQQYHGDDLFESTPFKALRDDDEARDDDDDSKESKKAENAKKPVQRKSNKKRAVKLPSADSDDDDDDSDAGEAVFAVDRSHADAVVHRLKQQRRTKTVKAALAATAHTGATKLRAKSAAVRSEAGDVLAGIKAKQREKQAQRAAGEYLTSDDEREGQNVDDDDENVGDSDIEIIE